MIRCPNCITRVPDIPENASAPHYGSRSDIGESVEVCVIMPLPARTQHTHNVTAQTIFANFEHHPIRRARHWPAQRRENIDSFMTPIVAARSTPGVLEIRRCNLFNRHRQLRCRIFSKQRYQCSDS